MASTNVQTRIAIDESCDAAAALRLSFCGLFLHCTFAAAGARGRVRKSSRWPYKNSNFRAIIAPAKIVFSYCEVTEVRYIYWFSQLVADPAPA